MGSACQACYCSWGLGLALGEAGTGVRFDNAGLAQSLGLTALVLILAEGGLTAPGLRRLAALRRQNVVRG